MKHRTGQKTGKLARVLAVIAIVMVSVMTALVSLGGMALADSPDLCWRVVAGSAGVIDPPTLTYNESYGVYFVSDSPFRYDDTNYTFSYFMYHGAWEYLPEGIIPIMMGEPMGSVDGEVNVDVGLYSAIAPPPYEVTVHMTIYYTNGNKSNVEDMMDAMMGSGNWSCDVYHEGVFVNDSEEYVYHAPSPICVPVPTPTLSPGDSVSEFIIPEYNESSAWVWSATTINMTESEGEDQCDVWKSIWDDGGLIAGVHPYNMVASQSFAGTAAIGRNILAFDTSSIPDDAVISGAYLRVVPYQWVVYGDGDNIVVGGTHNTSIFPIAYDWEGGGGMVPVGNYSTTEFYGDFGRLDVNDVPIVPMELNYNESLYIDVWLNSSGLSYINPEGLTALTLRTVSDMNYECPAEGVLGESLSIWAGNLSGEELSPSSRLVVAWHISEDEGGAGLVSPQVAIMMDIVALLFLTGFIIGLLFVIAKNEGMSMATKAGAITTITVMAVVGVIIIESLVVAFK
jgi:hypothetical protein